MHDTGLTIVKATALAEAEQKLLGFEAVAAPEVIPLPDPFTAGKHTYIAAHLSGVEPDGIRITHDGGAAKINYELLEEKLQTQLGGFEAAAAATFRTQEEERQKQALIAIDAAKAADRAIQNAGLTQVDNSEEMKDLISHPNLISQDANVKLTGSASGGMRRDVTWQTDYGSYNHKDLRWTPSFGQLCG